MGKRREFWDGKDLIMMVTAADRAMHTDKYSTVVPSSYPWDSRY